jgi:hypothetical protein
MYWDSDLVGSGTGYWSSTMLSDYSTTVGWDIDFSTGNLTSQDKNTVLSIRCVRGVRAEYCGDGETNASEVCDGNSATCESVLGNAYTGTATCAAGCAAWDTSACVSEIHPPATVSASDGSYTGYIRITWSTVTNAELYYVYRSASETGTYTLLNPSGTASTTYDDPPPTKNYHFYKVAAFNSLLGYSELSAPDSGWCY